MESGQQTGENAFGAVQVDRLLDTFMRLVELDSPSGRERPVAEFLVERLTGLDMTVDFDEAHRATNGDCGNLFAWKEGSVEAEPVFFSAHMDTVLPTAGLRARVENGTVRTDGTTILGADDRAAIAAYLEALTVVRDTGTACGPVQLILTVSEQPGLLGARNLDYSKVRAVRGYVYDSSGDVGQLIVKGPFSSRVRFRIHGKKAHLGLAPDEGVSAIVVAGEAVSRMRLGRVDEETVASVGLIQGGELPSIIPDEVEMVGEARSFSADKLAVQLDEMGAEVRAAAERHGARADVLIEKKYDGWELPSASEHVQAAVRAARKIGAEPYFTETLGGADTNIFMEHGLTCMTLGLGFQNIHSFDEYIAVDNLVATAQHVTALLGELRGRA